MKLNLKALLSDTNQLTRIIILLAVVLVLAIISFGGYYYYDRYYTSQPTKKEVSLAQAEQAVRDDPQNTNKRLELAQTYLIYRRFDDALAQANQVNKSQPDNQAAWLVMGIANANNGKPADAIEPLTKYVDAHKNEDMAALDKGLESALFYLGDSYLQLGQPDKAVPPLEMVAGMSKTDADAIYKLGMAYSGIKEYEKATNMFLIATSFVPDYLEAYQAMAVDYDAMQQPVLASYARGMIAYSKKDYKTALPILIKAAQDNPGFAPTFIGLGQTYEALKDLQNARSSYQAAMNLDPTNFTASDGFQRTEAGLKK